MSPKEYIETRIKKQDGCWLWTGHVAQSGYAVARKNGKQVRAHRMSYEVYKGKIPDGLHIDHKCFTRSCVNPDHLEAVTQAENNRRSLHRMTYVSGEKHGRAVLSKADVLNIFKAKKPLLELAKEYNVSRRHISDIKNKKRWKHLWNAKLQERK